MNTSTEITISEPIPENSVYPEGKRNWFYTLFAPCFSKKYIDRYDKKYYHKVLWFKYTTDGRQCCGLYVDPTKDYSFDSETVRPECLFFCDIFIRFIRIHLFCGNE